MQKSAFIQYSTSPFGKRVCSRHVFQEGTFNCKLQLGKRPKVGWGQWEGSGQNKVYQKYQNDILNYRSMPEQDKKTQYAKRCTFVKHLDALTSRHHVATNGYERLLKSLCSCYGLFQAHHTQLRGSIVESHETALHSSGNDARILTRAVPSAGLSCYWKDNLVTDAFEPCFKGVWASDFPYVLRMDKP